MSNSICAFFLIIKPGKEAKFKQQNKIEISISLFTHDVLCVVFIANQNFGLRVGNHCCFMGWGIGLGSLRRMDVQLSTRRGRCPSLLMRAVRGGVAHL